MTGYDIAGSGNLFVQLRGFAVVSAQPTPQGPGCRTESGQRIVRRDRVQDRRTAGERPPCTGGDAEREELTERLARLDDEFIRRAGAKWQEAAQ